MTSASLQRVLRASSLVLRAWSFLISHDLRAGAGSLWGQAAVLAAAISYAVLWLAVPAAEQSAHLPRLPITWLALAWLGVLGACLAYMLYYYLIQSWGATRATVVTYVYPVIGLLLGVTFLGEMLNARIVGGTLLVVSGIVVASRAPAPRPTLPSSVSPDALWQPSMDP